MSHNDTITFIKRRVRRLVFQSRLDPETCQMARGYLNRVFLWALYRRDVDLMNFVTEQEEMILGKAA